MINFAASLPEIIDDRDDIIFEFEKWIKKNS
jgi:hypothetical protein